MCFFFFVYAKYRRHCIVVTFTHSFITVHSPKFVWNSNQIQFSMYHSMYTPFFFRIFSDSSFPLVFFFILWCYVGFCFFIGRFTVCVRVFHHFICFTIFFNIIFSWWILIGKQSERNQNPNERRKKNGINKNQKVWSTTHNWRAKY